MNQLESVCKICTRLRKDKKMDLSVCIITKNENEKLKRCLKSLAFLEADIVVVDTGFNDETKKLVTELNGRYFTFEWCDDFSAARNYSLEQAYYDDIMVIDSDEWLDEKEENFNKAALESFMRRDLKTLACCYVVNISPGQAYGEYHTAVTRIFSKKYFHYEGKAHEQPVPLLKSMNKRIITLDLKIYHDGYAGDQVVAKKSKRNLDLLLEDIETEPDKIYLQFQTGRSYLNLGEYEQALKYFELALANPDFKYNYVFTYNICEGYLKSLLALGQTDLALDKLAYFAKKFPNLADFWYDAGNIYLDLNQPAEAISAFKRAVKCTQVELVGKDGDFSYYSLGQIYSYLKDLKQAKFYYEQCQPGFKPAKEALAALKQKLTVYIVDVLEDEAALKKTLASLVEWPFEQLVLSSKVYEQETLAQASSIKGGVEQVNQLLNANPSLLLYAGETLVDCDFKRLADILESKQAFNGYCLLRSPNQVKALGEQSYYHELRLVLGQNHCLQAGLIRGQGLEKTVSLTIASPLAVRQHLKFKKDSSAYANLLFMQADYQAALDALLIYLKTCDYGLEESLNSVAHALLASAFLKQFDEIEANLDTWGAYYQGFAIYQFSLSIYLQAKGKLEEARKARTAAEYLANSLSPSVNQSEGKEVYNEW